MPRTRRGLRARLLLLVSIALLAPAGLAVFTATEMRRAAVARTEQSMIGALRLAAQDHRRAFDDARQLLTVLSQLPAVAGEDFPACNSLFAEQMRLNPRYANIGYATPDGRIVASGLPIDDPVDASHRTWFRRAVETRAFAAGDYQIGAITKRATVNPALPVLDAQGRVRGVLFAALDLKALNATAAPGDLPGGSVLFALDSRGTVLVRQPDPVAYVGRDYPAHPLVRSVLERGEGTVEAAGFDGIVRLFAFRPLRVDGGTAAYLGLGIPRTAITGEADAALARNLAAVGAALILALLAAWIAGNLLIVRPAHALVDAAARLGTGDMAARVGPPYAAGEIGALQQSFDDMAAAIQKQHHALVESDARFREIADSIREAYLVLSAAGETLYASPAVEAVWGRKVPSLATLLDSVHADDRERLAKPLRAGASFDGELRTARPDGWVRAQAVPVRGSDGAVARIIVVAEDITERRKLEEQFLQSQKMDALGRLAGGVAHDFNNLLTVMSGYAELLAASVEGPAREQAEEILAAARRASSLTRQLLAFSRKQITKPAVLDLGAVAAGMEPMLRRLIGESIVLTVVRPPTLGRVRADAGQIEQVILNLVVNARDAMPRGGRITVETADVELDEAYARTHADVAPGAYVLLAVTDTGTGMDEATQKRLFEPFFTTKPAGRGTGLGLSTVYGVVRQSRGHIWVYSETGRGTTFKVYLPRVEPAEPTPSAVPAYTERPRTGAETVLVVDDDPNIRALVCAALRGDGYTLLEAADGAAAESLAQVHSSDIHLLLTDSVLPFLNGMELAKRLAARRPTLRVLFMSGYSEVTAVESGAVEPGRAFLAKPFTLDQLRRKVREVLDA